MSRTGTLGCEWHEVGNENEGQSGQRIGAPLTDGNLMFSSANAFSRGACDTVMSPNLLFQA